MASLSYIFQLQGNSFSSLSQLPFKAAVVDMDETHMSAEEVAQLKAQGKVLFTYLSIGECESYRTAYWSDDWNENPPDFVLSVNPDWPGNYRVKFWDSRWQDIILARVEEAVNLGYVGIYCDIVDAYTVDVVREVYTGKDIRQDMIDFVLRLADKARSLRPGFQVIPQNAVGLLATSEDDASIPNLPYLQAIDGIGVEDLWFNDDRTSTWTSGDLKFIQNAVNAGKYVLATSYPTQSAKQNTFVQNAIAAKLVPFVGDRDLDMSLPSVNYTIPALLIGKDVRTPWDSQSGTGNSIPVVKSDAYTVIQDASLSVNAAAGVLGNDTAPQGETLLAQLITPPSHGLLVLQADGSFTFTPSAGYVGNDSFTYRAVTSVTSTSSSPVTVNLRILSNSVPGQTLTGNSSNNTLIGGDGPDVLDGKGGNDTLKGGLGDDKLIGGSGKDVLSGGGGSNIFVFTATSQSTPSARDVITDFDVKLDKLDLSGIDGKTGISGKQKLVFLPTIGAGFTGAGQVRFYHRITSDGVQHTYVDVNVNSGSSPEMSIDLLGNLTLTIDNFIL